MYGPPHGGYFYDEPPLPPQASWINTLQAPIASELHGDVPTIIKFDAHEELLWIGTRKGRMLSYLADQFQPHTRFPTPGSPVNAILFDPSCIIVLGPRSLSAYSRGGAPTESSDILDSKTLDRMSPSGSVLRACEFYALRQQIALGGSQKSLFLADARTGQLAGFTALGHDVGRITSSSVGALCVGGASTGEVTLFDGRTPRIIGSVSAHPKGITSISADGTLMVTTGLREGASPSSGTPPPNGTNSPPLMNSSVVTGGGLLGGFACPSPLGYSPSSPVPDVFCKVFDVRMLRPLPPISVTSGACATLLNPTKPGNVAVLSSFGMWQEGGVSSDGHLHAAEFFRAECFAPQSATVPLGITCWSMSSSAGLLAMIDSAECLHIWQQSHVVHSLHRQHEQRILLEPERPPSPLQVVNGFSQPTVFPSHTQRPRRQSLDEPFTLDSLDYVRVYADAVVNLGWTDPSIVAPVIKPTNKTTGPSSLLSSVLNAADSNGNGFNGSSSDCLGIRPPLPLLPEVKMNLRENPGNPGLVAQGTILCGLTNLVARARSTQKPTSKQTTIRNGNRKRADSAISDVHSPGRNENPNDSEEDHQTLKLIEPSLIPRKRFRFRPVDHSINHSLFPFASFNRSLMDHHKKFQPSGKFYPGLENSGSSWDLFVNACVQVLYSLIPLRNFCAKHVCTNEFCLRCELGFIFHMMNASALKGAQQGTVVCQATRLCRVLKRDPVLVSLVTTSSGHPAMVAGPFVSHILSSLSKESSDESVDDSTRRPLVERLFTVPTGGVSSQADRSEFCLPIKLEESKSFESAVVDALIVGGLYKDNELSPKKMPGGVWAARAAQQEAKKLPEKKTLHLKCPPVLFITPQKNSATICWRKPDFLPSQLELPSTVDTDSINTTQANNSSSSRSHTSGHSTHGSASTVGYELIAVIEHIADVDSKQAPQGHLVSFVQAEKDANVTPNKSGSESSSEAESPIEIKPKQHAWGHNRDHRIHGAHSKPWILLNDYVVSPSNLAEALDTTQVWKKPVVLVFRNKERFERLSLAESNDVINSPKSFVPVAQPAQQPTTQLKGKKGKSVVSPSPVLSSGYPSSMGTTITSTSSAKPVNALVEIANKRSIIPLEMFLKDQRVNLGCEEEFEENVFAPLSDEEMLKLVNGGLTVALDAEFVATELGSMEIREDGTKEVLRPQEMTLGRVSVLRVADTTDSIEPIALSSTLSSLPIKNVGAPQALSTALASIETIPADRLDAVPFIDHYVATDHTEIKDYVTRFSGLREGDLDIARSKHWLVHSKSLYLKLRFLVDCGCKFIGHGLNTDFRIINLAVPKAQLIDTVELFNLPGQRFLSLKYLTNRLLNQQIQGETHCSTEDAKAALDLWRVYKSLKKDGRLEQVVQWLYDTGRHSGWK